MARRYPGSLVARVLINRYYALRKKYSKPTNKAGRLDFLKHWFLNWEGLLIGGVFVGGLGVTAVKLYLHERVDDLARRGERCQLYDGSCMMAASHLTAIQGSQALYRALVQVSAQRSEWQQQWQRLHQQRTQLAAQQVQLWEGRTARWMGQPITAAHSVLPAPEPPQQQQQQQQQQQAVDWQEQRQQLGGSSQVGAEQVPHLESKRAEDAHTQPQQQQQQHHERERQHQGQQREGGAGRSKEQQHQQQLPLQLQQLGAHQVNQQQPQPAQQPHAVAVQEPKQQQKQQQQQQQQQQQSMAGWRGPVVLYCTMRLRQAQRWLAEEQLELELCQKGLMMWQQLGQHAAKQVERLQQQEQQQLLMLMSHTAQRTAWQQLKTHTAELELWFDLPSLASLTSWLQQQRPDMDSSGTLEKDSAAAAAAAEEASEGTEIRAAAAPGSSRQQLESAVDWLKGWGQQQRQQQGSQSNPTLPAAAAAGVPSDGSNGSSSSIRPIQHWIRIRLLLPKWIPDDIEQRDFDLLCQDYLNDIPTEQQQQQQRQDGDASCRPPPAAAPAGAKSSRSAASRSGVAGRPDDDTAAVGDHTAGTEPTAAAAAAAAAAAGEADAEIELDGGGVLVEIFEEALDVVEALWDAADSSTSA